MRSPSLSYSLVSVIADDDHLAPGIGNVDEWIFHVYCLCTEIAVIRYSATITFLSPTNGVFIILHTSLHRFPANNSDARRQYVQYTYLIA